MMPLTTRQYAREKADTIGCIGSFIDASRGSANVGLFLVTWRRQISPFVHRYPSPVGRLGHTPCQAPDFLYSQSMCYRYGQGFAQNATFGVKGWNKGAIRAVTSLQATTCKGAETWITKRPKWQSWPSRCWALRPVATRLVNKHCLAARQVQVQPLQPGATRLPGLPLVARPMSPTAKLIRNAADTSARSIHHSRHSTVRTARPDGLFYAIAAGCVPGQEKTKRKGQTCSTRS